MPSLSRVSGDNQSGTRGSLLVNVLKVKALRDDGTAWNNKSVSWSIPAGDATVSTTQTGTFASTASTTTGSDGTASIFVKAGNYFESSTVQASATLDEVQASVTFTVTATGILDFSEDATTRSFPSTAAADTNIGEPVSATHWTHNDDSETDVALTYSLSGTDATKFVIDASTGQLRTKAGEDYTDGGPYTVTVKAADVSGGTERSSDTIAVTIYVTINGIIINGTPHSSGGASTSQPSLDTRPPPKPISFSELMFASRDASDILPQWIELHNASDTQPANLRGWHLRIERRNEIGEHQHAVITLKDLVILPDQTALIVTRDAPNAIEAPKERIYSFFVHHPRVFNSIYRQTDETLLGENGFYLQLSDPYGGISDVVGNLDGDKRTADAPAWALPSLVTEAGFRTSLLRRYQETGVPFDGREGDGWNRAADVALEMMSYWGKATDVGNPGDGDQGRIPFIPPLLSFSELMWTSQDGLHSLPQWIELYNASETETVNLNGWQLKVEARHKGGEHQFGGATLADFLIPPGQTALLVTSRGRHSQDIPEDRVYYLYPRDVFTQRSPPVENRVLGQQGFFLKLSDPNGVVRDIVGNLDGQAATRDQPKWALPLGETPQGFRTSLLRLYNGTPGLLLDGKASENWQRAVDADLQTVSYWGTQTDIGNPGYAENPVATAVESLLQGQISFSELMLTSRGGLHSLPQWIELYNASETEAVELRGWELEVEGYNQMGEHWYGVAKFADFIISPNQTALIVTSGWRRSQEIVKDRVYYLHPQDMFRRGDHRFQNRLLGQSGFFLKLSDADGVVRDVVGNLDGDETTVDKPSWELPTVKTDEGFRVSLMRRYYHVTGIPLDGRTASNWVAASNLPLAVKTYWGLETDIGNPGHKGGGALPVALSHFRPERTETGPVVIKWTTASETDNAGFNILRSQQRQGRFVRLNPKLIPGGGTTSERHHYTWTDTTANRQIVYYYRLEDVSFSGSQRQLRTVRLRGHVSASGKLTTRWSDLKREK